MTAFYFAFCLLFDPQDPTALVSARCDYVTRAECELVYDDCYIGWVKTPLLRNTPQG